MPCQWAVHFQKSGMRRWEYQLEFVTAQPRRLNPIAVADFFRVSQNRPFPATLDGWENPRSG
jgi:hypothetical protein